MTIQQDVLTALEGHAGNAALVGTRIYPVTFPLGATFPCQTYTTITAPTEMGAGAVIHGQRTGIQLDHWAETYAQALALATAARAALLAMAGATVDVHERRLWNEMDGYDADSELYRWIQEWWFVHS